MASLREIRRKIKSVRSTEQITKAMKMIAAARMRRAQASILASRPFAAKMEEVVQGLAALERAAVEGAAPSDHPFFRAPASGRSGAEAGAALILVTADKGLCGAFNANALRMAIEWIRRRQGRPILLAAVGRKARDFASRLAGASVACELAGIFPKVSFAHAELLGEAVISAYLQGRAGSVTAIYNEFRSVISQRVVERELLPIPISSEPARAMDFRFEPERRRVLAALLPRYLKA